MSLSGMKRAKVGKLARSTTKLTPAERRARHSAYMCQWRRRNPARSREQTAAAVRRWRLAHPELARGRGAADQRAYKVRQRAVRHLSLHAAVTAARTGETTLPLNRTSTVGSGARNQRDMRARQVDQAPGVRGARPSAGGRRWAGRFAPAPAAENAVRDVPLSVAGGYQCRPQEL